MDYKNIYLKDKNIWKLFPNPEEKDLADRNITIDYWVTIGDWVKIGNGVTLGKWVTLKNNVTLGDNVVLGDWVVLGNNVILGDLVQLEDCAILEDNITINNMIEIKGGYKYKAFAFWDLRTRQPIIGLGCYKRTIAEWENDFDNNIKEFPLGSKERKLRMFIFNMLKQWLNINKPDFKEQGK